MSYGQPTYQSLGPELHKALAAVVAAYEKCYFNLKLFACEDEFAYAHKVLAKAEWIRTPDTKRPDLRSYASGSGALSFSYVEDDKSTGHPTTIGEVANSWAWKDIQDNVENFDHILADFGSPEHPQILAFGPVRRIDETHLRMYAYGKIHDVRYEPIDHVSNYTFWYRDERLGPEERELQNLSMRGILNFFLEHEEVCTRALAWRDLAEAGKGVTHRIPVVK